MASGGAHMTPRRGKTLLGCALGAGAGAGAGPVTDLLLRPCLCKCALQCTTLHYCREPHARTGLDNKDIGRPPTSG